MHPFFAHGIAVFLKPGYIDWFINITNQLKGTKTEITPIARNIVKFSALLGIVFATYYLSIYGISLI